MKFYGPGSNNLYCPSIGYNRSETRFCKSINIYIVGSRPEVRCRPFIIVYISSGTRLDKRGRRILIIPIIYSRPKPNMGILCLINIFIPGIRPEVRINPILVAIVTPAIRIRLRPGHPGSPDVLSANGSLHFGRYSEACNGRVERFLCQVQIYFRSYYSGFSYYVLAFSNDLPTLYIARPMTKRHFAGDWFRRSSPPDWGGIIISSVFLDCCDRFILPGHRSI